MKKDEAAVALWVTAMYSAKAKITPLEKADELEREFLETYEAALSVVQSRPWWKRLGNLLP